MTNKTVHEKQIQEMMDKHDKIIKRRGELRKQGYSFVGDYEVFDVVVACQKCGHTCDLENVVIAHNKEIIKLACPMCLYQGLEFVDTR